MTYNQWAARHPQAASELQLVLNGGQLTVDAALADGKSEVWAQQQVRLKASHAGALSWRNNVGATPAKCPDCGCQQRPIRYGLANDSSRLNKLVKSSDLILAIPRLITPDMVGSTIAQFGSIETKRPGNNAEMPTIDNLNKKGMQELLLYFLRERVTNKNFLPIEN